MAQKKEMSGKEAALNDDSDEDDDDDEAKHEQIEQNQLSQYMSLDSLYGQGHFSPFTVKVNVYALTTYTPMSLFK